MTRNELTHFLQRLSRWNNDWCSFYFEGFLRGYSLALPPFSFSNCAIWLKMSSRLAGSSFLDLELLCPAGVPLPAALLPWPPVEDPWSWVQPRPPLLYLPTSEEFPLMLSCLELPPSTFWQGWILVLPGLLELSCSVEEQDSLRLVSPSRLLLLLLSLPASRLRSLCSLSSCSGLPPWLFLLSIPLPLRPWREELETRSSSSETTGREYRDAMLLSSAPSSCAPNPGPPLWLRKVAEVFGGAGNHSSSSSSSFLLSFLLLPSLLLDETLRFDRCFFFLFFLDLLWVEDDEDEEEEEELLLDEVEDDEEDDRLRFFFILRKEKRKVRRMSAWFENLSMAEFEFISDAK